MADVESDMVSPELPFLLAKHLQFPQLLLVRLTLLILHRLHCPFFGHNPAPPLEVFRIHVGIALKNIV